MKHLILCAAIITTLSGCGVVENMAKNCNGDELCMLLFGRAIPEGESKDKEQDEAIKKFRQQLTTVQDQQAVLLYMLNSLSNMATTEELDEVKLSVTELAQNLSTLQLNMINGYYTTSSIDSFINTINMDIQSMLSQLAVLQGYNTITQVVSPCGITTGYYEVLLRTSDGHILAYFENGGQRYLSGLPVGTYSTTDGRGCTFTIKPGGDIDGSRVL